MASITINKTAEKEIAIVIGNGADITSKPFQITEDHEFDPDARIEKQWSAVIKADNRYIPILQKVLQHTQLRFGDIIESWDEETAFQIFESQLNERFESNIKKCES